MFVHIWRMRARKKKAKDYEGFGRQTTLPALKKIDGCQGAYFIKVFEAHKPEYLWVVFWRDQKAFEAARTNPVWREQRRKFEAGKFYKTIPLELRCECLGSFSGAPARKPRKTVRPSKAIKKAEQPAEPESPAEGIPESTSEGE
ncbi:MAG: antibiotic biosynthesis monooxygenase family protein [Terriglobia bacterium]